MESILHALHWWFTKRREHDAAMDGCEQSWDYFGFEYIDALDKAEKEFVVALNAYIDQRIKAALGEGKTT